MVEYRIFECEDGTYKVQKRVNEGEWASATLGVFTRKEAAQHYIDAQMFVDSVDENNAPSSEIIEEGWKVESMNEEPVGENQES